ncbi:hypothetical protein ACM66B_001410 [Microbotryomycetes sp. NB124-2]
MRLLWPSVDGQYWRVWHWIVRRPTILHSDRRWKAIAGAVYQHGPSVKLQGLALEQLFTLTPGLPSLYAKDVATGEQLRLLAPWSLIFDFMFQNPWHKRDLQIVGTPHFAGQRKIEAIWTELVDKSPQLKRMLPSAGLKHHSYIQTGGRIPINFPPRKHVVWDGASRPLNVSKMRRMDIKTTSPTGKISARIEWLVPVVDQAKFWSWILGGRVPSRALLEDLLGDKLLPNAKNPRSLLAGSKSLRLKYKDDAPKLQLLRLFTCIAVSTIYNARYAYSEKAQKLDTPTTLAQRLATAIANATAYSPGN